MFSNFHHDEKYSSTYVPIEAIVPIAPHGKKTEFGMETRRSYDVCTQPECAESAVFIITCDLAAKTKTSVSNYVFVPGRDRHASPCMCHRCCVCVRAFGLIGYIAVFVAVLLLLPCGTRGAGRLGSRSAFWTWLVGDGDGRRSGWGGSRRRQRYAGREAQRRDRGTAFLLG